MKLQRLKQALIAYVANSAKAIWSALEHPLSIVGKKNCDVADYRIYGNSVQNGEPTPGNPVEVQSVGELVTEGEYAGKYRVSVRARGKNLFDKNNVKNGFYASQKGESANTQMCCTNYFIPIKPNTEYTWTSFRGSHGYGTVFYDESKSSVSRQFIKTLSFTTPDNAHYMKLNVYISEKETFQLEYGDTATEYEPYIEPQTVNIYLDEPLRRVGEFDDYIDFEKGVVVRNVEKRIFDGTESWTENHWSKNLLNQKKVPNVLSDTVSKYITVSNHLTGETWGNLSRNNAKVDGSLEVGIATTFNSAESVRYTYVCPYSTLITVDEWKAQLATWHAEGNPFIVWCAISPIEQPIELPTLPQFKGTTVYEAQTEIPPSGIEVQYYG